MLVVEVELASIDKGMNDLLGTHIQCVPFRDEEGHILPDATVSPDLSKDQTIQQFINL